MPERGPEREKKDKKEKKTIFDVALATYEELKKKIEELSAKKRQGKLDEEGETQLQECKTTDEERRRTFFRTRFGQRTSNLRDRISNRFDDVLKELQTATPDELSQKAKEARNILDGERTRAIKHWQTEPKNLKKELQGIAQYELEPFLQEKEQELNKTISARGEKAPREGVRNIREQVKKTLMEANPGMTEEKAEEWLTRLSQSGRLPSYSEWRYFREQERKDLMDLTEKGERKRREVFDQIFQHIDMYPSEFYSQAFQGMGLDMINKLAEYRRILGEIEGLDGQEIRDEYMSRIKLKQMLHDAVCIIEQGAAKPDRFQEMMERFTPELFDQLFQGEEEVELGAHLYEVGMTTLRSRNENWIPPEKLFRDPKIKGSEIDKWVRERFEEIIKAKYNLSDADFKTEWSEQRIRRAMALGKGYEMVVLRMPEMVARGRVPEELAKKGVVVSPAYEDFVRPLDAFEHFLEKFQFYDDPGAHLWLYFLSGGDIKASSREEIKELFKKEYGVDPTALRMVDVVNFLAIGGPWSKTGWRREMVISEIPAEEKKWIGLAFRLAETEHEVDEDPKFKDKSDKAKNEEKARRKKDVFLAELERNPLRILREAELQDGEIFDSQVREKVIEETLRQLYSEPEKKRMMEEFFPEEPERKKGESEEAFNQRMKNFKNKEKEAKEVRERWLNQIENPLVLLAQLEADPDEGRKGKINFDKITDSDERKRVEAYYQAIEKVIKEYQRTWTTKEGETKIGNLLQYLAQKDFPFAPGLEDVPWSDFHFAKMGHKGFARRLRDYMGAHHSMNAIAKLQTNFGKLRKAEDIVAQVDEIWQQMRDYDKKGARERVAKIYEGIGRLNAGNFWKRLLPVPLGSFADYLGDNVPFLGPTSYAKEIYGGAANSWRGIDLYNFLKQTRLAGHITKEQEEELRKNLRCNHKWLILEGIFRITPVATALIIYEFIKELAGQMEEQIKEQG